MRKMKILFGFDERPFEDAVKRLLATEGVDAEIAARQSKESIKSYIANNPDCEAVVLLEATRGQKPYTAEEVAQLTDARDINVIIVLTERYLGTAYMRTLYSAGVLNAVFQKNGKSGGAHPTTIAALLLQGRTRRTAREYYGIAGTKIDMDIVIDNSDYATLYEEFKNDENGMTGLENYINICSRLSVKQIYDFTKRLPKDDRDYLAQFEEFHTIVTLINRFGFGLKVKRPKKVFVGLNQTVGIGTSDDRIVIKKKEAGQVEPPEQLSKKPKRLFGKKNPDISPAPKPELEKDEAVTGNPEKINSEETRKELKKPEKPKPSLDDFVGDIPDELFQEQFTTTAAPLEAEKAKDEEKDTQTQEMPFMGGFADLFNSMRAQEERDSIEPLPEEDEEAVGVQKMTECAEELLQNLPETEEEFKQENITAEANKQEDIPADSVKPKEESVSATSQGVMEEEEEEPEREVFFEYDPSYDDLVIRTGIKDRIIVPVVIALITLAVVAIGVLYWKVAGNGPGSLF